MDTLHNNSETWQVELGGDIRDLSFDEMTAWIAEGSLLKIDRVKKGNLRWIEAGKVPALTEFFNAKDHGSVTEPVVTTSSGASNVEVLGPKSAPPERVSVPPAAGVPAAAAARGVGVAGGFAPPRETPSTPLTSEPPTPNATPASDVCAVHTDAPAAFVCDTCCNSFCKACPNTYGSVKICPFCGAMCKSLAAVQKANVEAEVHTRAIGKGFGFGDFAEAIKYPFKFKLSLFFGAVLFALFSVGQGAAGFGGAFMLAGAIMCFMCANMLSFGVLSTVVNDFSQGKIGGNFMPSFDDFSIWDDVVHPFFLMIGVYISSFGPLAATFLIAIFFIAGAMKPATDPLTNGLSPEVAAAPGQLQQGQNIKQLIAQQNAQEQNRIERMTDATKLAESEANHPTGAPVSVPPAIAGGSAAQQTTAGQPSLPPAAQQEEEHFKNLNDQINQARKAQLEGALGQTPETKAAQQKAMIQKVIGYGAVFLIVAGLCLLWGLFYLPAACCVAGYTGSFGATLNPTVGLDTIKRLGVDYIKILGMGLLIGIISLVISGVLAIVFNAFALPGVGNLPAKFVGSLFGFYLSVVFSCILGFAIYKAADRLELYKG